LLEELSSLIILNIQSDAPLTGVGGKPEQALLRVGDILIERADVPLRVSPWFLNLDDIGSKVPQNLACQMPQLVGEIQNSTAG
jgi:hypothetical protein